MKDAASEKAIDDYLTYLGGQGLAANFRPGDWQCSACQGHCYGKRMDCHACGALGGRPEVADPALVAIFGSDDYFVKSRARDAPATGSAAVADAEEGDDAM